MISESWSICESCQGAGAARVIAAGAAWAGPALPESERDQRSERLAKARGDAQVSRRRGAQSRLQLRTQIRAADCDLPELRCTVRKVLLLPHGPANKSSQVVRPKRLGEREGRSHQIRI